MPDRTGLRLGKAAKTVATRASSMGAALEREFALTLVNRGTRPVRVTDAGVRLMRHAAAVLGHVTAAEDELRAVAGLQSGTLRLGAFLSACNSFVPAALARFDAAHPDVEVQVEQLEEPEALRRLRSGDLDVAVVWRLWQPAEPGGKRREEGFEQVHLAEGPYRSGAPGNASAWPPARAGPGRARGRALQRAAGRGLHAPVPQDARTVMR